MTETFQIKSVNVHAATGQQCQRELSRLLSFVKKPFPTSLLADDGQDYHQPRRLETSHKETLLKSKKAWPVILCQKPSFHFNYVGRLDTWGISRPTTDFPFDRFVVKVARKPVVSNALRQLAEGWLLTECPMILGATNIGLETSPEDTLLSSQRRDPLTRPEAILPLQLANDA